MPPEVLKQVGALADDFAAGHSFARNAPRARILGLIVGGAVLSDYVAVNREAGR